MLDLVRNSFQAWQHFYHGRSNFIRSWTTSDTGTETRDVPYCDSFVISATECVGVGNEQMLHKFVEHLSLAEKS